MVYFMFLFSSEKNIIFNKKHYFIFLISLSLNCQQNIQLEYKLELLI